MDCGPVDAKALANILLDWADECGLPITPMKLQKLTYYCHAEFLAATGRPLVAQEFEAWDYGPVIPGLFHEFKSFGREAITSRAMRFDPISARRQHVESADLGEFQPLIRQAFALYVGYSASALSRMSHVESGPWSEALSQFRIGKNPGRKIAHSLIIAHHRPGPFDLVH